MSARLSDRLAPAAGMGALLFIWELSARAAGAAAVAPAPSTILGAIFEEAPFFLRHGSLTAFESAAGLIVALAVAFVTASAAAYSRRANAALMPIVLASQTVPLVAIGPLLAGIIGDGLFATILITAWLCWFPAAIAFTHGLIKVHPDRLALFQVAGATRRQTYLQLRLPGAAAAIVAGVRASAGFAVIGAIVAEYGGAQAGLGALIIQHVTGANVLSTNTLWALVFVCSALGALMAFVAHLIAKTLLRRWLVADA